MKKVYADNSATTKTRDEAVDSMLNVLKEDFGNPSSIHSFGRKAKSILNNSREEIAKVVNAKPEEIYFTSGGTEADNLVLSGIEKYVRENSKKSKHIISSKIEHSAIKTPLEVLENNGWEITWLNVDKEGFVSLEELKNSIKEETALVSIIHANNEIGTIQDLKTISNICKEKKVLLHSDMVQSFCKAPINLKEICVDFASFSSHKIYGPKGVGALYINSEISSFEFTPLFFGGSQEQKIRPGTENLAGIVGFATAAKFLISELNENKSKLQKLEEIILSKISQINNIILTGAQSGSSRIPGHISFCAKDLKGENLVLQFDLKGIAVSSGSACSSNEKSGTIDENAILEPSHVLKALGVNEDCINGSIRISLGKYNTEEEAQYLANTIESVIQNLSSKELITK